MLKIHNRNVYLIPFLAAIAVSYSAAYSMRFDFSFPRHDLFFLGLTLFLATKGLTFWIFRLHQLRWRHAGLFELHRIAFASLIASAAAATVTAGATGYEFPRSVYLIDAAFSFLLTATIPFSARMYWEVFLPQQRESRQRRPVLIYGAGEAGLMLGKEIRSNPKLGMKVLGYLDDDPGKTNSQLVGFPVMGTGRDAASIVLRQTRTRNRVTEIIIAMPAATGQQMRTVIANCRAAGVPFKTLPGVGELLSGKVSRQIRNVSPNDLLGREPVRIDEDRIREAIRGESVLVTGGCGSIGSEICRQVASYGPSKLVMFDQAESEMFMLAMELRSRYPQLQLVTEIGDITKASRVDETIARHEIKNVFHAAAYKHVPLMEENIAEAVENNVLGTYNVARAAHKHGVQRFVLISTDKAVNPTSIMGMTKRVAEQIVSGMPLDGSSKSGVFVSVRFGNVLGSSGSVIPIFQRQIAAGGPVTVTHPDMRRFFMSISEAVQLVLQASTMSEGRDVFVLDMGEPVSILELANNMIRLAGFVPGEDIDIRVTGLRPGEKLYEELRLEKENVLPTLHQKIRRFRSQPPNSQDLLRWLENLRMLLMVRDPSALKTHLTRLVPEYQGSRPGLAAKQPEPERVIAHA